MPSCRHTYIPAVYRFSQMKFRRLDTCLTAADILTTESQRDEKENGLPVDIAIINLILISMKRNVMEVRKSTA